jgi:DNA invertase Pin-like site-specific DNA recombinase
MEVVVYYAVQQGGKRSSKAEQRAKVQEFQAANDMIVAKTFTDEYKPGSKAWPNLEKAVAYCQDTGLSLILAQIGRLRQNPTLMAILAQSEVEFVAIDNQQVNSNTAATLAAFAQEQAVKRSQATKVGLDRVRSEGQLLGGAIEGKWNGLVSNRGWESAALKREQQADDYYQFVLPRAAQMRRDGSKYTEIAEALNKDGFTTLGNKPWNECSIHRLLARAQGKGLLRGSKTTPSHTRERTTDEYYQEVMPLILQMREEGTRIPDIVETLNQRGYTNKLGKPYTVGTLYVLLRRAESREARRA